MLSHCTTTHDNNTTTTTTSSFISISSSSIGSLHGSWCPPLEDAISHMVVRAEDLLSFIDFSEIDVELDDQHRLAALPVMQDMAVAAAARELPEVDAAPASPAFAAAQPGAEARQQALAPPEDKTKRNYTKQACVACKRKKQKCEEGRPCHRCINGLRTCTDVAPRRRRRRKAWAERDLSLVEADLCI